MAQHTLINPFSPSRAHAAIHLGEQDAFRLAACGRLALHAGQRCLAAALAAAQLESTPSRLARLDAVTGALLQAVEVLMGTALAGESRSRAAAAFAASVAKPASMLPWLEAVAAALSLLAAQQGAASDSCGCMQPAPAEPASQTRAEETPNSCLAPCCAAVRVQPLVVLTFVATAEQALCSCEEYGTHAVAAAEGPAHLHSALVDVMLDACLPVVCEWLTAALGSSTASTAPAGRWLPSEPTFYATLLMWAAEILGLPCLEAALGARLRQPGGAAHVQLGVQLAAAIPAAAFPGANGIQAAIDAHEAASYLLSTLVPLLHEPQQASEAGGSQAAGGAAGGGAEPGRQPGSGWSCERRAAARHVVRLVPHMAAVLRFFSACGVPAQQTAATCWNYAGALLLQASGKLGPTAAGGRALG